MSDNLLVDKEWIDKHNHDLDNWTPKIELIRPGSKQTITIKNKESMTEVVKIMRENRKKGDKNELD